MPAIRLTSASSQYLSRTTGLVNCNADYWFSLWVMPVTLAGANRTIFYTGAGQANEGSADDYFWQNTTDLRLAIYVTNSDGSAADYQPGSTVLALNTWYFVCGVRSGSTLTLYLGTLNSLAASEVIATMSTAGRNATTLNQLGAFKGGSVSDYWDGRMHGFKAGAGALSIDQIRQEQYLTSPLRRDVSHFSPLMSASDLVDYAGAGSWTANGTPTTEDGPPIAWADIPFIPLSSGPAAITASDSATVTEGASAIAATLSRTDSATLTDTTTALAASLTTTDSATLTDTTTALAATLSRTDSATLTDTSTALAASVSTTDSGALTEGASAISASASATDSATLSDTAGAIDISGPSDSGALTEASAIAASASATDSGALSEASAVDASVSASDSATLTDVSSLAPDVNATDSGTLSESAGIVAEISASDSAALSESSSINTGSNPSADDVIAFDDSAHIDAALVATDSATLSEISALAPDANTTDNATLAEAAALFAELAGVDSFTLSESSHVQIIGNDVDVSASDEFTFAESASIEIIVAPGARPMRSGVGARSGARIGSRGGVNVGARRRG